MRPGVFGLLAALAVTSMSAFAAPHVAPSPLDEYRITSWTGGDGITLGIVRSLAQDSNGYLWLASEAGLVRFDRSSLVTGTSLPMVATRALLLARDGTLWVGYGARRGIYHIAGSKVREVHLADQIPGFVNAIVEDRDGTIWAAHDGGLHRF